jgi:hypothetical protein
MSALCANGQIIVKDVYVFPLKQGSKEWVQVESIEKRIAALQMPDSILVNISTEGLLETCLQFPYLTDILFCENYQKGFEVLTAEFNGFRELLKRNDLTDVLLKKYKGISREITKIQSQSSVEKGRFTFCHFVIEFMLTQDVFLKNLSLEKEKQLFLLSIENQKLKSDYSNIFGSLNALPTNLLYAKKIMKDPNFKFENAEQKIIISEFIRNPTSIDKKTIGYIENYINFNYK